MSSTAEPVAAPPPILSPSDLGLPPRFTEFRPRQAELALDIAESASRFSLLPLPTGGGKSLTYMAVSRLLGGRTLVLVGTKGLQAQIVREFQQLSLVNVQGQSNYRCVAVEQGGELEGYGAIGSSCAEAPCKVGMFCSRKLRGCLYYDVIREASGAEIVVTNYSYWLTIGRHADPLAIGKFDLLVLDEAHSAPDWLSQHCTVELKSEEVQSLLKMKLPPIDEGVEVWASWAKEAAVIAGEKYERLRASIAEDGVAVGGVSVVPSESKRAKTRTLLRLMSLRRDLTELAHAHSWRNSEGPQRDVRMPGLQIDWVAEMVEDGQVARFTPVWAHPYAEQYLFRGIPKVVLSSATLSPSITKYLGIDPADSEWHEAPSSFDHRRRPFIYCPVTRVDHRMTRGQMLQLVSKLDRFIDARLKYNGIIHSVSYDRARQIMEMSRHKDRMVMHNSTNLRRVIEDFKSSRVPRILVSPSVVEGFDFPDNTARWQVLIKVPFVFGREPVEKARRKSDPEWANYVTALKVVQVAGRIMRSMEDWGETVIFDAHWGWFKNKAKFPKWFRQSWRMTRDLPPPLAF